MSKKFEVGDKVRLNAVGLSKFNDDYFGCDLIRTKVAQSSTATVEEVRSERTCTIRFDDTAFSHRSNGTWLAAVDWIELVVEEKRKFAVGDKVRDIKYDKGATGVVVEIYENFGFPYSVRYDVGGGRGSYGESALELIAPAAPSPKFNVGDRVKVVGTYATGEVRRIIIDKYSVSYDMWRDVMPGMSLCPESSLTSYKPRTWSKPEASQSIALDVIDSLVDEMTTALRAHGGDCETRRFGDVMVVVENGQAKIYRLEATSNVE